MAILIEAGADAERRDEEGFTPIDYIDVRKNTPETPARLPARRVAVSDEPPQRRAGAPDAPRRWSGACSPREDEPALAENPPIGGSTRAKMNRARLSVQGLACSQLPRARGRPQAPGSAQERPDKGPRAITPPTRGTALSAARREPLKRHPRRGRVPCPSAVLQKHEAAKGSGSVKMPEETRRTQREQGTYDEGGEESTQAIIGSRAEKAGQKARGGLAQRAERRRRRHREFAQAQTPGQDMGRPIGADQGGAQSRRRRLGEGR